jgi:hypothetical protein
MSLANIFNQNSPQLPVLISPLYNSNLHFIETGGSLTGINSGSYIFISNELEDSNPYTINLPNATDSAGITYKFIVNGDITSNITISAPNASIYGSVIASNGNLVNDGNITEAITNIVLGYPESPGIGDRYDFISDGLFWYVDGITAVNDSVTFS